jgi:hypothetical protein
MTVPTSPALNTLPRRRLPRWAVLLLTVLLLGAGLFGYVWYASDRALREVEAEADRLDPGWRLADLEAARSPVPDAENSARQVLAARALMPAPWLLPSPGRPGLADEIYQLEPPVRLSKVEATSARAELARLAPALAIARPLVDLPRGRYAITWSDDGIGTIMDHLGGARQVAGMLQLDAALRAHDGDVDGALASCRAALNAGRSVGDEPTVVSQMVRLAGQRLARQGVERVLAQGEPSDAALAAVQRLLEDEEKAPLQLVAARGERATIHRFLEVTESGRFNQASYNMRSQTGSAGVDNLLDRARARSTHVAYLRYLNELVEISKLPEEQQAERFGRPGLAPPHGVPRVLEALTRGEDFPYLAERFRTGHGLLRCALAGVAAERYRRAHGQWPARLDDLVPEYLAKVPADPSDGRPLRLRRTADGVAVEVSVPAKPREGPQTGPFAVRRETGFRLWDVEKRRQTPREE